MNDYEIGGSCNMHGTAEKFEVHVTIHRVKFVIIKTTRCTNFLNLFLE